jgi:Extensin-like protein C-terminus
MRRALAFSIGGGVLLLALAGCGRGFFMGAERAPWRHEAEVECMKSGAVKIGVVQIDPIEGPGACGMDFPLKVTELGEALPAMGYADELRPPAPIPGASADMPNWPPRQPRYQSGYPPPPQAAPVQSEPVAPVQGERMRWVTGPPGIDVSKSAPAGQPMSISPQQAQPVTNYAPPPTYTQPTYRQPTYTRPAYSAPRARALPSDIPDDAVIPRGGSAAVPEGAAPPDYQQRRMQPAYNAPVYQPPRRELPRFGPERRPQNATLIPAELAPPAKLACPIVSALDRWVSEGVQPAAMHWFHSPVVEIHQIGSYACRHMVGGSGTSEHSFGNALDISGFTLADGRNITVKDGWHGTAAEQGFLHDVQLYACETFTTVLAPGYNIYHYNHIHVDLMRRRPGYRPCRPDAIPGEVVAARVRAHYAAHHRAPAYTGSIAGQNDAITAVATEDGFVADDGSQTSPPIKTPSYLGRRIKLPNEDRFAVH